MPRFTLVCPKCGQSISLDPWDLDAYRVTRGLYAWWCQVCDYDVQWTYLDTVTLSPPTKHKRRSSGLLNPSAAVAKRR